jgi:hypothetical protein
VLETTRLAVPPARADAVELLDEAASRTRLYFGHLNRVRAQQLAMKSATSAIQKKRARLRVVVVVDYKMKFEPL